MKKTKSTKKTSGTPMVKSTKKESKTKTSKNITISPVSTTRTSVLTYTPVSHHIYHDGYRYRVRVQRKGTLYSEFFTSKKKVFEFRKKMLA